MVAMETTMMVDGNGVVRNYTNGMHRHGHAHAQAHEKTNTHFTYTLRTEKHTTPHHATLCHLLALSMCMRIDIELKRLNAIFYATIQFWRRLGSFVNFSERVSKCAFVCM